MPTIDELRAKFAVGVALKPEAGKPAPTPATPAPVGAQEARPARPGRVAQSTPSGAAGEAKAATTGGTAGRATTPGPAEGEGGKAPLPAVPFDSLDPEKRERYNRQVAVLERVRAEFRCFRQVDGRTGAVDASQEPSMTASPEPVIDSKGKVFLRARFEVAWTGGRTGRLCLMIWNRKFAIANLRFNGEVRQFIADPNKGEVAYQLNSWLRDLRQYKA